MPENTDQQDLVNRYPWVVVAPPPAEVGRKLTREEFEEWLFVWSTHKLAPADRQRSAQQRADQAVADIVNQAYASYLNDGKFLLTSTMYPQPLQ